MGAIRLLSEALVASEDNAVIADLAGKIQTEAERINRLVEDILDLAILESSGHEPEELDICDVVQDAVTQTRAFAAAVGIAVEADCVPVTVFGDHRSLVSAITNLVENALSQGEYLGQKLHQAFDGHPHIGGRVPKAGDPQDGGGLQ